MNARRKSSIRAFTPLLEILEAEDDPEPGPGSKDACRYLGGRIGARVHAD